jgi:hypothetical protein
MRAGDLGLQGDDLGGRILRLLPAGEAEHLRDILLVARLLRGEALLQVIIAVGQADAGLAQPQRITLGIAAIVIDPDAEEARPDAAGRTAHQLGNLLLGLRRADLLQIGLERLRAEALDRASSMKLPVERGYLGAVDIGVALAIILDELAHPRLDRSPSTLNEPKLDRSAGDLRAARPIAAALTEEVLPGAACGPCRRTSKPHGPAACRRSAYRPGAAAAR